MSVSTRQVRVDHSAPRTRTARDVAGKGVGAVVKVRKLTGNTFRENGGDPVRYVRRPARSCAAPRVEQLARAPSRDASVGRRVHAGARLLRRADVEHAGETSAKARRKGAGHQLDAAHGGVHERAEQPTEVERVVDRMAIEQDEVLVRLAAANIEPGIEVVARHDPGEQLQTRTTSGFPRWGAGHGGRPHGDGRDGRIEKPLGLAVCIGEAGRVVAPPLRLTRRRRVAGADAIAWSTTISDRPPAACAIPPALAREESGRRRR